MTTFALIHSPLVGPLTWRPVADELRRVGAAVVVPSLRDANPHARPYWLAHARAVAGAIDTLAPGEPPVLVGHSGAGALLPAVRVALGRPVAAYIFVDAGIPEDGRSRLDTFPDPQEAAEFRGAAVGGLLPTWTEEDLRTVIPDDALRTRFAAELRPLPLAVYEERIPVFRGWPDAPCAYLRFAHDGFDAYAASVARARRDGWPIVELPGLHFHMLVDPPAVAAALIRMVSAANLR